MAKATMQPAEAQGVLDAFGIQLWQDWVNCLRAQLDLLDLAQRDEPDIAFDQDSRTSAGRKQASEAVINAIPAERRAAFQSTYQAHRRDLGAERRHEDTDTLDRVAYEELLTRAQGNPAQGVLGEVVFQGETYQIDTRVVNAVPAHFYGAASTQPRSQARQMLIFFSILGLFVIGFIVLTNPAPPAQATTDPEAAADLTVNGASVAVWEPRSLTIQPPAQDGETVTVALEGVAAGDWPPAVAPNRAFWQRDQARPLSLCVAPELLPADGAVVQLASTGDAPTRIYTIRANATGGDLVLASCTQGGTPRWGQLTNALPPPSTTLGQALTLGDTTPITVTRIVATPLADGEQIVSVMVEGTITDWVSLRPRLLLDTGASVEQSAIQTDGTQTTIQHLIPQRARPLEVAWDLIDPTTGQLLRWRTTLTTATEGGEAIRAP